MHTDTSPSRSYGLLAGLIVGSVAGAGLALWQPALSGVDAGQ